MSKQKDIQKIQDKIYLYLRKEIIIGNLKKGERLTESKIAEEYDIGRVYVKDIFQRLENEDLAFSIPMKGYFVKGLSKEDLIELSLIRKSLESLVIEKFVLTAEEDDIQEVVKKCRKKILFLNNNETEFAVEETKAIFDYIYKSCEYKKIVSMLKNYEDYFDIIIKNNISTEEDVKNSVENTKQLEKAFLNRDVNAAVNCLAERHNNYMKTLL